MVIYILYSYQGSQKNIRVPIFLGTLKVGEFQKRLCDISN